jgi:hypothetical protein
MSKQEDDDIQSSTNIVKEANDNRNELAKYEEDKYIIDNKAHNEEESTIKLQKEANVKKKRKKAKNEDIEKKNKPEKHRKKSTKKKDSESDDDNDQVRRSKKRRRTASGRKLERPVLPKNSIKEEEEDDVSIHFTPHWNHKPHRTNSFVDKEVKKNQTIVLFSTQIFKQYSRQLIRESMERKARKPV